MPKKISVFISSTCKDLAEDCRRAAITTIDIIEDADAIAMENWSPDYGPALDICLEKLGESTHYLGIFAHRYGWRPPDGNGKSITEIEFDHAAELKKVRYILVPDPYSKFYITLKKRAKDQTPEDEKAQRDFLSHVGNGKTCDQFKDLIDLVKKVGKKVLKWQSGGFIDIANAGQPATSIPKRTALITLGRKEQIRQFEDCFDNHLSDLSPTVACFLIHGQPGYCHEEMLSRLQTDLEKNHEPLRIKADASANWRSKDLTGLLEIIGHEIDGLFAPKTVAELAARLKEEMKKLNVLLRLENLELLNLSLAEFTENFWKPLVQSVGPSDASLHHKLIGLVSFRQALDTNWEQHLFRADSDDDFDSARLIALPELNKFSKIEIQRWLEEQKLPLDKAKETANSLYNKTGGAPSYLCHELMDESIWCE